MQLIIPFDKEIMGRVDKLLGKWRKSNFSAKDVLKFNDEIDRQIPIFYSINFEVKQ